MNRYYIEDIKCDIGVGGIACGPVAGPVIAEAKVKSDDEEFYMSLAEVDGIPNFFKTKESTYEMQLNQEMTDEEVEVLQENYIKTEDYEEILSNKDSEWYSLFRYLIYIVRSDWDECERFLKETSGKYLDEIEVPFCDLEEE